MLFLSDTYLYQTFFLPLSFAFFFAIAHGKNALFPKRITRRYGMSQIHN